MPITPAIRIDPAHLVLEKAITVKLPTCVAEYGQDVESSGMVTNRTIKPEKGEINLLNFRFRQLVLVTCFFLMWLKEVKMCEA